MSTPENGLGLPGSSTGLAPPGELRPHQGQLPNPGDTPSSPSAAGTTPGLALAGAPSQGSPFESPSPHAYINPGSEECWMNLVMTYAA